MTATWVGGGYINGAAEATIKDGIVSTYIHTYIFSAEL